MMMKCKMRCCQPGSHARDFFERHNDPVRSAREADGDQRHAACACSCQEQRQRAAGGQAGAARPRGAGASAAGESHRRSRARESAGARRSGRSGARRHPGSVRRRQQVQSRKTSGFFELRQAPHQGRDPRQPAAARLGLARHAPPPQAGGSRHARSGRHAAAHSHRSGSRARSSAWMWIAGAP